MTAAADIARTIAALLLIAAAGCAGFYAGMWRGQTFAYEAVLGSMHDAVGLQLRKAP
jgi:hypothetical protein